MMSILMHRPLEMQTEVKPHQVIGRPAEFRTTHDEIQDCDYQESEVLTITMARFPLIAVIVRRIIRPRLRKKYSSTQMDLTARQPQRQASHVGHLY